MQLITVTEANNHLRLNLVELETSPVTYEDERLPDLLVKIEAAEAVIFDYLKTDGPPMEGSPPVAVWGDQETNVVRAAVLLLLSALWDDAPERTVADYMAPGGTIPLLLARLRDPTLA